MLQPGVSGNGVDARVKRKSFPTVQNEITYLVNTPTGMKEERKAERVVKGVRGGGEGKFQQGKGIRARYTADC